MGKDAELLFAPDAYWSSMPAVRAVVTNGCGAGGGWKGWLVPDTIYLLCITAACNIHDWMYTVGMSQPEKEEADRVFLNNMIRLIDAAGGWSILRALRRNRARGYYNAVKYFGGPAFWHGKNPRATLAMVPVTVTATPAIIAAVTIKSE